MTAPLQWSFFCLSFVIYCSHARWDVNDVMSNRTCSISHVASPSSILHNENNAAAILIARSTEKMFYNLQKYAWSFLAFVESNENAYFLCLLVSAASNDPSKGEIVWTANSFRPVSRNAVLQLQPGGDLVLSDSDSDCVWSTGTGGRAEYMEVQGGGVLMLFDSMNNSVWCSKDYPTDTLLLGHKLVEGNTLHSRSSRSDLSRGAYSLIIKSGGLGLYLNEANRPAELYWMWKWYDESDSTLDYPGRRWSTCSFLVDIAWPASKLALTFVPLSLEPNCSTVRKYYYLQSVQSRQPSLSDLMFVRLDHDGNLRGYAFGRHEPLSHGMTKCQLPNSCGEYGVCSTYNETCECPNNGTHHLRSAHSGLCGSFSQTPSCVNVNASWQMFSLTGIEYHRNRYAVPLSTISTKEDCSDYCLKNCSCTASFYLAEFKSCYFVSSQVGTLARTSNEEHLAFIKLPSNDLALNTRTSHKKKAILAAVTVFAVAVSLVCSYSFKGYFINDPKPDQVPSSGTDSSDNHLMSSLSELTARNFSLKEIETVTRKFCKVLGSGGFGTVYEGLLGDGMKVAVKRLEIARQGKKEFYSEVAILGLIHHWNLVQLLGFCSQKCHKILVYEHMGNGSLDQWLFNENNKKLLTWPIRFNIILGTARGLAYLHEECRYKIVHLDVKPQNILLDENFVAKVSDFGMATLMSRKDSRVMTTMRGTPGYLAPEWLFECAITEKSDVYSFGMVLLEIIGGRKNCNMRMLESDQRYFPAWALSKVCSGREMKVIDPGLADKLDWNQAIRVLKIGFLCIQEKAQLRPSMGAVVQMLEGEKEVPEPPLKQCFQFAIANKISPASSSRTFAARNIPSPAPSPSISMRFKLSR